MLDQSDIRRLPKLDVIKTPLAGIGEEHPFAARVYRIARGLFHMFDSKVHTNSFQFHHDDRGNFLAFFQLNCEIRVFRVSHTMHCPFP